MHALSLCFFGVRCTDGEPYDKSRALRTTWHIKCTEIFPSNELFCPDYEWEARMQENMLPFYIFQLEKGEARREKCFVNVATELSDSRIQINVYLNAPFIISPFFSSLSREHEWMISLYANEALCFTVTVTK